MGREGAWGMGEAAGGGRRRHLRNGGHPSAGYFLGGGMGPAAAEIGLACDRLVQLEMVLANGTIVTASKQGAHHGGRGRCGHTRGDECT